MRGIFNIKELIIYYGMRARSRRFFHMAYKQGVCVYTYTYIDCTLAAEFRASAIIFSHAAINF
jgi:hypothetical protein